jgi:two-component system CheB/CheR fusion protein
MEAFFKSVPEHARMAFVVIQHMAKHGESNLKSLLTKYTKMKVVTIQGGEEIAPETVYIKPPDKDVALEGRTLALHEPTDGSRHLPIDVMFRSMAMELGNLAIGVILSGTGQDGTLGLKAIDGAGGMVMVQNPDQAEYPGMPKSAMETGQVDYVQPAEEMGPELVRYAQHPYISRDESEAAETKPESEKKFENVVQKILYRIRKHTGHDFTHYKRSTIRRRIDRRMAVNQINDLEEYEALLERKPEEIDELFRDLLINVTQFFRDAEAWDELREHAVKPLLDNIGDRDQVRAWVTGCATGEEAYSLAMLLFEEIEHRGLNLRVKIFGTDINERAITRAREGVYPESITQDVDKQRLRRFFEKTARSYTVKPLLREALVFAVHDVTRDPPFSRLDLACCRNLLIYMDSSLQKEVLPMLHYALRDEGYLFLGTSEGIGDNTDLFRTVSSKYKIYQARGRETRPPKTFTDTSPANRYPSLETQTAQQEQEEPEPAEPSHRAKRTGQRPDHGQSFRNLVERTILDQSAPGIVVDDSFTVHFLHGETTRYLHMPVGEPSYHLMDMVRGELKRVLRKGIQNIQKKRKTLEYSDVPVVGCAGPLMVDVKISTLQDRGDMERFFLVTFTESQTEDKHAEDETTAKQQARVNALEQQLQSTRQDLQATIEELETSNEELKSSNEEQQANLEELQSTNEELETSREELQSTNEELEGVNEQLQRKNQELMKANDDIRNIFSAIEMGAIFLDDELNIKRFNPAAKKLFSLREEDTGRPLSEISSNLRYDHLDEDAQEVLDTLHTKELEIQSRSGAWFKLRIRPYRSQENVIEGVVITLDDISHRREIEARLESERKLSRVLIDALGDEGAPAAVLDAEDRVYDANEPFVELSGASRDQLAEQSVLDLGRAHWDAKELEKLLAQAREEGDVQGKPLSTPENYPAVYLTARRIGLTTETEELLFIILRK